MKTLEIIGYKRANLGKKDSRDLRDQAHVPCVLYGGEDQVHFHSPMFLFRDLVYTRDAHFVNLNIEGDEYRAILQDIQFHPVSELILHADFLLIKEDKPVKMAIPVAMEGSPMGVSKGGKLVVKTPYLNIKALPKNMPEAIPVPVDGLDLGKTVKVKDLPEVPYEITNNIQVSIASIEIPRSLRSKQSATEEEE